MALADLMGDHPEYEDLSDWVSVACFNAKKYPLLVSTRMYFTRSTNISKINKSRH